MSLPEQHLLLTSLSATSTAITLVLVDKLLVTLPSLSPSSPTTSSCLPSSVSSNSTVSPLPFLLNMSEAFLDHTDSVIQTTNLYKNCFVVQFLRKDLCSFLDQCQVLDYCLFFHSVFPPSHFNSSSHPLLLLL